MAQDIRWIQRFNNYGKALARLEEAIYLSQERELTSLEQQGLIQAFEFTFDLAWKTLQDLLRENQRPNDNGGPSVIIAQAAADGYIADEALWRALKKSRELTSHSYDEETADEIAGNIVTVYHGLFIQLSTRLQVEKLNREKEE
ncbi:MAG: HI0074 family nucleotidyltransferase substrate-binding subunit [Imperialibacter sp.]|uniref:HI0074 family nucleotidyltransferase substrate-binding subunit n=1 Tax=Imperialibacter sp. TaxID=2038411 RepID=UPI0032EC6BFF